MRKNLLSVLLFSTATLLFNNQSNAQGTLLYYWNFNSWTPAYSSATPVSGTTGGLGIYASIPADYAAPALSTTNAMWVDRTLPGTPSTYSTYCDVTTGDTVNGRMGAAAGNGFRARNPNDNMELLIYAPTSHYANIRLKYACQLSSTTSGDSVNVFSYSIDSGSTWISSGSGLSEWVDSGGLIFSLINVHVNDPLAYNNRKFVFRIQLAGRNSGTSGNNRFDNVTVEGDTANPTLGITQLIANSPVYNLFPNPANTSINISGNLGGEKSVVITNVLGQIILTETKNDANFSINTSSLISGVYYMTIRENETGSLSTMKFMKQ